MDMTSNQLFIVAIVVAIASPLFLFLSGMSVLIFNWLSSAENRRRDVEDRHEVVRQAKATADLAHAAAQNAEKVASKAEKTLSVVQNAVVNVGHKADAAYKEANRSNLKIQAVQDALTEVLNMPQKAITETTMTKSEKDNVT
jgi:hypothetical protein